MASNAKALSFLSGDLSLSGSEVSINVAGSVQSDSITGSTITMKNTGSTIVASDGTTAVLSESGGTVTLTADEANVGSNALVVDSSGYVIFNSSLTNNTYIKGGGYYTFAANGSTLNIQPTTAFTALILVYDPGGGAGAAFLSTYQNSVVKIAGDAGWYDSDTAGNFCVFKSINSHNSVTVKNNSIYVRNFHITVISTG
jgi:hypothetical protein